MPTDWEQLAKKNKQIENSAKQMENQLKAIYHTYPIIMEEEKPENVKKYISELEKKIEELEKYEQLPDKSISKEEYQELSQQLQAEKEKNKNLADKLTNLSPPISINEEEIIKGVAKLLTDTINPLRLGITELLKKQAVNNSQLNNSLTELPANYKMIKGDKEELLRILEVFKLKLEDKE